MFDIELFSQCTEKFMTEKSPNDVLWLIGKYFGFFSFLVWTCQMVQRMCFCTTKSRAEIYRPGSEACSWIGKILTINLWNTVSS